MKTVHFLFGMGVFLLASPALADIQFGGSTLIDGRVGLEDGRLLWNENRLALELNANLPDDAHLFSSIWIRGFGETEAVSTSGLMGHDKRISNPWDLMLREAYVDLYGFLSPDLDLRIGRQRIPWGVADKINPTDNLNPDDLEDIWDIGRHTATNSILANYYRGDVTLTAVFTPGFMPATFPPPSWSLSSAGPLTLPEGLILAGATDNLQLPDNTLKDRSSAAAKLAMPLLGWDLSLSYFGGRSDFPVPIRIAGNLNDDGDVVIESTLSYPRLDILGADITGALGDVGLWAEAGVFFPDEVQTEIDMSALGAASMMIVSLEDEPFVKFVVGSDYTFKNGIYVNGQFVHGYVHEMGVDALHDYFFGGIERKFRNESIKVTLAGGFEVPDINSNRQDYALFGMPEVSYSPIANSEFIFGLRIIDAEGATGFGSLEDMDEIYCSYKHSF